MLRIVGGKYRHLLISAPEISSTRPTTDKVREALMSALGMSLKDAVVLDLFAGSGALGLEALSRGSKKAYFCDNNMLAYKTIKNNIEKLRIDEEVEVIFGDYISAIKKIKDKGEKIDIVFLDPPYAKEEVYDKVTDYLLECDMLSEKAIIVKEWNKVNNIDERFTSHKSYKYGKVNILIERR